MGGRSRELPAVLVRGKLSNAFLVSSPPSQLQWLVVRGPCSVSPTNPSLVGQEGACSGCGESSISSAVLYAAKNRWLALKLWSNSEYRGLLFSQYFYSSSDPILMHSPLTGPVL